MRLTVVGLVTLVAWSSLAYAQAGSPMRDHGYVEATAQSAFGNVTTQSYGAEIGVAVRRGVDLFVDIGKVRDASPSILGANAQQIAGFLSQTQSGVTFHSREPVMFGLVGVRVAIPPGGSSAVAPYVLAGGGVARVSRDVNFAIGGTDVTGTLSQYGVVLGSDLSGSATTAMATVGGGLALRAFHVFVVDFQYRYGRVFERGHALVINRAGVGLGFRF